MVEDTTTASAAASNASSGAKGEAKGTAKLLSSPSSTSVGGKSSRMLAANYRTEEIRGYLFKKTRDGKWQKRWFETNGCFLTYYKKQGQKLLAALNLPQVGAITLLKEDSSDGPGLFTIELNERVYTIKARSHEEAAFWVDALLWRQAGGVVTQKSPAADVSKVTAMLSSDDAKDTTRPAALTGKNTPRTAASAAQKNRSLSDDEAAVAAQMKSGGCGACCIIQ